MGIFYLRQSLSSYSVSTSRIRATDSPKQENFETRAKGNQTSAYLQIWAYYRKRSFKTTREERSKGKGDRT